MKQLYTFQSKIMTRMILFVFSLVIFSFTHQGFAQTIAPACSNTIGGSVFNDLNGNGVFNTTDSLGFAGIKVYAFNCAGVKIDSAITDSKGRYTLTKVTAASDSVRIEFVASSFPNWAKPSVNGTGGRTDVQFAKAPNCSVNMGMVSPNDYCNRNPKLVTPCYIDGAVSPNTSGMNDVLVSLNYDNTAKTTEATRTEMGATWGLGYAKTSQKMYASAFLKRHVGLKDSKLGQIFVTDFATAGTPTSPWLDVSTLAGISGSWTYLTDAARGLTNAGVPSLDSLTFSKVAAIGLGDIDVSEDEKTLYVMDLTNRQLLAIDIATKALIGKYPVPDVCPNTTAAPIYFSAANANFTATDGKKWSQGSFYNTTNDGIGYAQTITNPNNTTEGTTDAALYATSVYSTTALNYNFPMGNGTYSVKVHLPSNSTVTNINTSIKAEGVTVLSGINTTVTPGVNKATTRTFTATVTDGVLSISLINGSATSFTSYVAVSGFEITPTSGQKVGITRPFATKTYKGKVYVGAVCDASFSQNRDDLKASVFEFNPTTGTYAATPTLNIPLTYLRGASASYLTATNGSNNRWEPWTSIYPCNSPANLPSIAYIFSGYEYDVYTQPVLSDIEFDVDGTMILGFFDRFPHQIGADYNSRPDRPFAYGVFSGGGVTGGDILRAYFNGSSYELESNAKEGVSSSKPATLGANNTQGPGGGEFYYGERLDGFHYETLMGGLALLPGSGEIRVTAGDPLITYSGGILALDNTTGNKIAANSITLYYGVANGVQNKANGLGDLELVCNPLPVQIGSRLWIDTDKDGVQDPCLEPSIKNVTVSLYSKTGTLLAKTTTDANGEYYFDATNVVDTVGVTKPNFLGPQPNTQYFIVIGKDANGTGLLFDKTAGTITASGKSYQLTTPNSTASSGNDQNDSDFALATGSAPAALLGFPAFCATTPSAGADNTFDAGFKEVCVKPNAGVDQSPVCSGSTAITTGTLAATAVTGGTWTQATTNPTGAMITTASSATSGITGLMPGVYQFIWTTATACSDTVKITVPTCVAACTPPMPTGEGVVICANNPAVLMAMGCNTTYPLKWYSDATLTTQITAGAFGDNLTTGVLTTSTDFYAACVKDATCKSAALKITVTVNPKPNAGADQTGVCTAPGTATLSGTPTGGVWSKPTSNLANINASTGAVSALSNAGAYEFIYTVDGCADTVKVTATVCGVPKGSIGNFVWKDTNNNGMQDAGEIGRNGVKAYLYKETAPASGDFVKIDSMLTQNNPTGGAAGWYTFNSLSTANYKIGFDKNTIPLGCSVTAKFGVTLDSLDSDIDPTVEDLLTRVIPINTALPATDNGRNNKWIDLGLRVTTYGSIGNFVWKDSNDDGKQDAGETGRNGVRVYLYKEISKDIDVYDKVDSMLTQNNPANGAAGWYTFDSLATANYKIGFDITTIPAGCLVTSKFVVSPDSTDSDVDPTVAGLLTRVIPINVELSVTDNDRNNKWIDLGLYSTLGSLGDFIWKDTNNNGIQDAGETGVKDVIVELYKNGTFLKKDTTEATGNYMFGNLDAATYKIKVLSASIPASCIISDKKDTPSNDAKDSDVDAITGFSGDYVIDPADATKKDITTVDAGLRIKPTLKISDPCTCFRVEYDLDEKKELFEKITITSSPGETWKVVAQTGMLKLDSLVKTPVAVGDLFTADSNGEYSLAHTIEDNIPYTITATNGTDTLKYGGVCSSKYPDITLTTLSKKICKNSPPVALTATANQPGALTFFYVNKTTGARVNITQFDPSQFSENDTIFVKLEAVPTDVNKCKTIIVQPVIITTVDCPVNSGSLGDFIWKDTNNNGMQDAGETGVKDVIVELYKNGTFFKKDTTDATGNYMFGNLDAATYKIKVLSASLPAGCTISTKKDTPTDDAKDSDVDPTTGFSGDYVIDPTDATKKDITTVDAALYSPNSFGSLGNYVWFDKDNDGIQEANEPPIKDFKVVLYKETTSNVFVKADSMLTNAAGLYTFDSLASGNYKVRFILPNAWILFNPITTKDNPATTDALDNDADRTTWFTGVYNINTTLPAGNIGRDNPTVDGGVDPFGTISNFVWKDDNNNGIQDTGEKGVPNIKIEIYEVSNMTTPQFTTFTDTNGLYAFDSLLSGSYKIKVIAAGRTFSAINQGADPTKDSDVDTNGLSNAVQIDLTLDFTSNLRVNTSTDAGLNPCGSLGDYVWKDVNNNGLQDATETGVKDVIIELYKNGVFFKKDTTDAAGKYLFTDLLAATYKIKVVSASLAAGCSISKKIDQLTNDAIDSDVSPVTAESGNYILDPLVAGKKDILTVDVALVGFGSIGDKAFNDVNKDGLQDATDTPVVGAKVYLLDINGSKIDSTTTKTDGSYKFDSLISGTYGIEFKAPVGTQFTTQKTGTNSTLDSDPAPNGKTSPILIDASKPLGDLGRNAIHIDAGIVPIPVLGSIGNYVWEDVNKDGLQDMTDLPIKDVQVFLLNASGLKIDSAKTDVTGKYTFSSLPAGTYQVQFVKPIGLLPTNANAGTDDTKDSDADATTGKTQQVTLVPENGGLAKDNPTLDAGFFKATNFGSIGNFVFNDLNKDGKQDPSDTPVAGVKVYLLDGSGNKLDSTTTSSLGKYLFDSLTSGTYTVEFKAPVGQQFTIKDAGIDDTKDSDVNPSGKTGTYTIDTTKPAGDPTRDITTVAAGLIPVVCENKCLPIKIVRNK